MGQAVTAGYRMIAQAAAAMTGKMAIRAAVPIARTTAGGEVSPTAAAATGRPAATAGATGPAAGMPPGGGPATPDPVAGGAGLAAAGAAGAAGASRDDGRQGDRYGLGDPRARRADPGRPASYERQDGYQSGSSRRLESYDGRGSYGPGNGYGPADGYGDGYGQADSYGHDGY